MHIYCEHSRPLSWFCNVLLNGELLRMCREACEERGFVVGIAHTVDAATGLTHIVFDDGGRPREYRKTGTVEIRLQEGRVPPHIKKEFDVRRVSSHAC
jgi:hypothetical protein